MKTDPLTVLWHLLRNNETGVAVLQFKFTWYVPGVDGVPQQIIWQGTDQRNARLGSLYQKHDMPTTVEIVDTAKTIPTVYISADAVKPDEETKDEPDRTTFLG